MFLFGPSAKVYPREIFMLGPSAKVYPREIFLLGPSAKVYTREMHKISRISLSAKVSPRENFYT